MLTSITCATSSGRPGDSSRPCAGWAIDSPMPDGVPPGVAVGSSRPEVTRDEARLLRRVRINLALWSGGVTLAVLLVLGAILYVAVDRSLSASGTAQLVSQANLVTRRPNPEDLSSGGVS